MTNNRWCLIALVMAGCSSPHGGNGAHDMSVPIDAAVPLDMTTIDVDLAAVAPADLARAPDDGPPPVPPPTGAFGVWLLDGNANDSSGNGNDGTVSGTFNAIANRHGVAGKAASFNGATTISFATTSTSYTTALSLSFWIKATSGATTDNGWVITEGAGTVCSYSFAVQDNNLWMVSGGGSTVLHTFPGGDTGWVHVVVVWNIGAGTLTPYINGVAGSAMSFTMVSHPGNLLFGRRGSLAYYNGALDDVRMYDRLLTTSEVDALYAE